MKFVKFVKVFANSNAQVKKNPYFWD